MPAKRQNLRMTQPLVDIFNAQLPAYNACLDGLIEQSERNMERRYFEALKFQPIGVGDLSDKELRKRLRTQRLRLGSILKARALELLRQVVPDTLHQGRYSVGLPYAAIIDTLLEEFPEAKVTSACLRWYVARAKGDAHDLGVGDAGFPQYRPRSRDSAYAKWAERRQSLGAGRPVTED